jgi:formate/nitrite transporter FocA (FNT family)
LSLSSSVSLSEIFGFDAFSPKDIAAKVQSIGVTKTRLPLLSLVMLSVLAGAFIGLGTMYSVIIKADPTLGFAARQVFGGIAFSLGLILVVVAGAELFTGNNLLAMAWADGKISTREVLRNWVIVCAGNFVGATGLVALPFWTAFFKGILCNALVCMAVWMALAGRSIIDKAIAIIFPVSAFVAAGFEHSIANMFFIPMGMLLQLGGLDGSTVITWGGFLGNLVPVILGNIIGGSVLVGLVYFLIYRRVTD